MKVTTTRLPEVLILTPDPLEDARGVFYESYNKSWFDHVIGPTMFVQDNHSVSGPGVLRGLHFQAPPRSQGKLVRVVVGSVFDVAVDIRGSSSAFGEWVGVKLSADNRHQLWLPAGFAHGFLVLSDHAEMVYKTTDQFSPEHDRAIRWDDPDIAIDWPLRGDPVLSKRDASAQALAETEVFP